MTNATLIIGMLLIGTLLLGCVTISSPSQNNTAQTGTIQVSNCPNSTGDTVEMRYDGTAFWVHSFGVTFSGGWNKPSPGPNGDLASIPCHWGFSDIYGQDVNELYCAAGLFRVSKAKIISLNGTATSASEVIGVGFVLSADGNMDRNQFDTTTFHIIEMGCTDPIEQ